MFVCLQFYFHHSYEHENDYHDLSCHFADYFASQDLDQIYVNISSKPLLYNDMRVTTGLIRILLIGRSIIDCAALC